MKKFFIFLLILQSFLFAGIQTEAKYTGRITNFFDRYYANLNYLADVDLSKKNVEITLSLDENQFFEQDINFIKAVIIMQLGLDIDNGDMVRIFKVPFNSYNAVVVKDAGKDNKNFYYLTIILVTILLILFLIVVIFFIFYLSSMNRKIDKLMLENKQNILIAPQNYEQETFESPAKEVVMVDKDKKDNDILGILKKIDELDRNKKKSILKFSDLVKISDDFLGKYSDQVLGVAFLGLQADVVTKLMQNIPELRQQTIKAELEKNKELKMIQAEAIIQMQNKILTDVNQLIASGKIVI